MSKLQHLLLEYPQGIVYTSKWLRAQGYSDELLNRYKKSRWFESVGRRVMIRRGDRISWPGLVHTLQHQLGLQVHPGGRTALHLHGASHYGYRNPPSQWLFGSDVDKIPKWVFNDDWNTEFKTSDRPLLPRGFQIETQSYHGFDLQIPTEERALLEYLSHVPYDHGLHDAMEQVETCAFLQAEKIQSLLENCPIHSVKRLLLFLAEQSDSVWLKQLNIANIDLGKELINYVVNEDETPYFVNKYHIVVPDDLLGEDRFL
ncbi:MAG: AbiEi antitoxin N-terminal domain-containing protein [Flavobacteriaceae bacterium]|nr:AbiEi antitoxin N-terminal domain-containing protein [Flavobacteriaceae bacterium]